MAKHIDDNNLYVFDEDHVSTTKKSDSGFGVKLLDFFTSRYFVLGFIFCVFGFLILIKTVALQFSDEAKRISATTVGVSHQYIHSGAGHDAQFAAYMLPATMVFVQSKDGLSHCEPEYSSPEHCTEGASVMLNAVLKADAR